MAALPPWKTLRISHFPSLPTAAETGKDLPEHLGKDVVELDKHKA
jgi:hypothetical protein